jgi:hypothetical protein
MVYCTISTFSTPDRKMLLMVINEWMKPECFFAAQDGPPTFVESLLTATFPWAA